MQQMWRACGLCCPAANTLSLCVEKCKRLCSCVCFLLKLSQRVGFSLSRVSVFPSWCVPSGPSAERSETSVHGVERIFRDKMLIWLNLPPLPRTPPERTKKKEECIIHAPSCPWTLFLYHLEEDVCASLKITCSSFKTPSTPRDTLRRGRSV